ncbi:MAG: NAD(P)-binding domain-containing protein [Candidatus Binataceae bacterium]
MDTIIVGCGPYGLAAAAYLRNAGVETRVFGESMQSWRQNTPAGTFLRSPLGASGIGSPYDDCMIASYFDSWDYAPEGPIPLGSFVEYGQWFQNQIVPDLDSRQVALISATMDGFKVRLEDGEGFKAKRVAIATGIAPFAHRPSVFNELPAGLVSHSTDNSDLSEFSCRRVAVIGGGQSAIETGALLGEAGAEVEVIMRAPQILWLRGSVGLRNRLGTLGRRTDVGWPPLNQIIALPTLVRLLPVQARLSIDRYATRASVANWLKPRINNVKLTTSREVCAAERSGDRLKLILNDASDRLVDHVILATGFRIDLARLRFLAPTLLRRIERTNGYPHLNAGFESTVGGLHFLGAPAAYSFGPLTRFLAGTSHCAAALANTICRPTRVAPRQDAVLARWLHDVKHEIFNIE